MPLVKDGQIASDPYVRIPDDADVPERGPVLVSVSRYLANIETLAWRSGRTGVIVPNDYDIAALAPHLDDFSVVALVFPSFRDGRAYSQARILRERYQYHGELRATGQVLRDQFMFMLRAGFDALEVSKDSDAVAFAATVKRYSVFYQPTGDGRLPAAMQRLRRTHAATVGS
jgi:uncharacterized protein (DUF934 family)